MEDLELPRTAQENELSSIKQKISALRSQIEKEPGLGELASRVLVLENMNRRRNVIIWNIKSESKLKAKDHDDIFCMLQGDEKLRENPFERGARFEFPYIYMTDYVTKGVRDIRNSLRIKQKEFRAKGISAWIPLVYPPALSLIDYEEKVKLKWYKVQQVKYMYEK